MNEDPNKYSKFETCTTMILEESLIDLNSYAYLIVIVICEIIWQLWVIDSFLFKKMVIKFKSNSVSSYITLTTNKTATNSNLTESDLQTSTWKLGMKNLDEDLKNMDRR